MTGQRVIHPMPYCTSAHTTSTTYGTQTPPSCRKRAGMTGEPVSGHRQTQGSSLSRITPTSFYANILREYCPDSLPTLD